MLLEETCNDDMLYSDRWEYRIGKTTGHEANRSQFGHCSRGWSKNGANPSGICSIKPQFKS